MDSENGKYVLVDEEEVIVTWVTEYLITQFSLKKGLMVFQYNENATKKELNSYTCYEHLLQ